MGENRYNMRYTWYQMAWIVLIYSCLGWCSEVAFAALRRGVFVNRGFLNGPVCPIYGFGVLLVLLVLEPVKENLALLFFGSMVFCSLLEFIVGFAMERIFHDKWWDYSENPFNIKGYVCLEFSLMWGAACVLVVDVLHPLVMKLINAIPSAFGKWALPGLVLLLAADAALTLTELLKLPRRFRAMEELELAISAVSDAMGEKLIYAPVELGRERRDAFDEKHPDLARRRQEYARDILEKRGEINRLAKEKEGAGREALAQRKAELEERLRKLRGRNLVHRRITMAYPALLEGRCNGRNFRRLKEHYEKLKTKNGEKK